MDFIGSDPGRAAQKVENHMAPTSPPFLAMDGTKTGLSHSMDSAPVEKGTM